MTELQTSASARFEPTRPRRLTTSVWLPWFTGLLLLLLLATFSAVFVGRDQSESGVPLSVLTAQKHLAVAQSELFRRSANEAVTDLDNSAKQLVAAPDAALPGTLQEMLAEQERWAGLAVVGMDGRVIAAVGSLPEAGLTLPTSATKSGLVVAEINGAAQLVAYAPLMRPNTAPSILLGASTRVILDALLESTAAGSTYVADRQARVLAASDARGETAVLPTGPLLDAGLSASNGAVTTAVVESTGGTATVISSAPVSGNGPAGSMDFAVVIERSITDLPAADFRYRFIGITFAVTIGILTLVLFEWIRRRVMVPLAELRKQSELVAYQDLSVGVPIGPFDEIGKISLALERIRIQLIKQRVFGAHRVRTSPPETTAAPADRQTSILVADDDPRMRSLLEAALAKPGRVVRSVSDGEEAVVAAMSDLPTLIVLNWVMPHLSGIDACRILKSDDRTADIPVIMLTAFGSEEHVTDAFGCGADDYLTKPFEIREIIAAVDAQLSDLGVR